MTEPKEDLTDEEQLDKIEQIATGQYQRKECPTIHELEEILKQDDDPPIFIQPGGGNMTEFETESQLVCEALVREIRDATRWSAIMEAWQALLNTRRKADSLIRETQQTEDIGQGEPKASIPS